MAMTSMERDVSASAANGNWWRRGPTHALVSAGTKATWSTSMVRIVSASNAGRAWTNGAAMRIARMQTLFGDLIMEMEKVAPA